MKSHMGFPLTPRSMTLDDLELHKSKFLVNFAGFRRFLTQQQLNEWRQASIVSDNVVSTSNWSNFWQTFASRGFVSDSWAFLYWLLVANPNCCNYREIQNCLLIVCVCVRHAMNWDRFGSSRELARTLFLVIFSLSIRAIHHALLCVIIVIITIMIIVLIVKFI